jgi:phage protein D
MMEQTDFEVMDRLFNVIKSAAEHPGKFPQIVAAAGAKLAEIEKRLADAAAVEKKRVADEATRTQVVADKAQAEEAQRGPVIAGRGSYIPGETEAYIAADAPSSEQPSFLDRRT